MKHGPNALIDENLPVVFLAAYDPESEESHQRYEKVLNNIKEVKSRDGIIVAIGNEGDTDLIESSDHFIPLADDERVPASDPGSHSSSAARLSLRSAPRMRHRSTTKSGEERYCRMTVAAVGEQ